MKKWLTLLLTLCLLCTITVISAQAEAEYPLIRSMEQLKQYLWTQTYNLESEIRFSYPTELEKGLEEMEEVEEILYNCGVLSWTYTRYRGMRRIRISDITYCQGLRIARAWALNRLDWLNREELAVLDRAQRLVEQALDESRTPLELERWIHDEIGRSVVYTLSPDGKSVYDTAVGALYYGQAECDGYADAFYLLGTLAGLNVGFQYGTTTESTENSAHLWNVIEIDGWWYHVDVTWNDLDYEEVPDMLQYRYFNVGADMFTDHFWNEEWSLYPLAKYTNWDKFFYTCAQSGEQGFGLYCSSMQSAAQYVAHCRGTEANMMHVMVDGTYENAHRLNQALKDVPLYGRWMTWTEPMGSYTLFDILFLE